MNWLKKLWQQAHERLTRIREWASKARQRFILRFVRPYRTVIVEESLPKALRRRTLYIVQEDGFLEQAAMICPCGCRRVLHMNLLTDERPCWRLTQHDDGTATLHPSVWRQKDCRSHFWFRRGRVEWCRDTAGPSRL